MMKTQVNSNTTAQVRKDINLSTSRRGALRIPIPVTPTLQIELELAMGLGLLCCIMLQSSNPRLETMPETLNISVSEKFIKL